MADHDDPPDRTIASTAGIEYTRRLRQLGERRWKQILNVQAPYRWNVRSLRLGRTLDIGCGIGRNLHFLGASSVGVDHNADSVALARARGLEAYSTEEFSVSAPAPESFDSLLVAHVVEHMSEHDAIAMMRSYLPHLRRGGRVCFITPQERGYRSDPTHIRFVDFGALDGLSRALGLRRQRQYSFPLPRRFGKAFKYNEFVYLGELSNARGL